MSQEIDVKVLVKSYPLSAITESSGEENPTPIIVDLGVELTKLANKGWKIAHVASTFGDGKLFYSVILQKRMITNETSEIFPDPIVSPVV